MAARPVTTCDAVVTGLTLGVACGGLATPVQRPTGGIPSRTLPVARRLNGVPAGDLQPPHPCPCASQGRSGIVSRSTGLRAVAHSASSDARSASLAQAVRPVIEALRTADGPESAPPCPGGPDRPHVGARGSRSAHRNINDNALERFPAHSGKLSFASLQRTPPFLNMQIRHSHLRERVSPAC